MAPEGDCRGVVKRWVQDRGFGFLIPEGGGDDVYVHKSELAAGTDLCPGDKVAFQLVDDGKGRGKFKARSVVVLEAGVAGGLFADLPPPPADAADPRFGFAAGLDLFLELAGERGNGARRLLDEMTLLSSLQCPFLVVSERQLVDGMRAPSPEEFHGLLHLAEAFVSGCEALRAVMLVDFEGEMPGHGGELTTAQFQFSSALDPTTLAPRAVPRLQLFGSPGLLVDLRSRACVAIVRRVMQSSAITKLLWGGDGDCQSLMYQQYPLPLSVNPTATVDVQLAFDAKHPIGMAAMLELVPSALLDGLPEKEQINWDFYHAQNCRALPTPLDRRCAAYAVDDLHRMAAIVGSKLPPSGSYAGARDETARLLAGLRKDPCGVRALHLELRRFERTEGLKRTAKAVQLARHVRVIHLRGAALGDSDLALVRHVEDCANAELSRAGVVVPADLSWYVREAVGARSPAAQPASGGGAVRSGRPAPASPSASIGPVPGGSPPGVLPPGGSPLGVSALGSPLLSGPPLVSHLVGGPAPTASPPAVRSYAAVASGLPRRAMAPAQPARQPRQAVAGYTAATASTPPRQVAPRAAAQRPAEPQQRPAQLPQDVAISEGHSMLDVEDSNLLTPLSLEDPSLPPFGLHGSYLRHWPDILRFGLLAGGPCQSARRHVHFAPASSDGAAAVAAALKAPPTPSRGSSSSPRVAAGGVGGMRQDCDLAVWVDIPAALHGGVPFFRSRNGAILSPGRDGIVPTEYIVQAKDLASDSWLDVAGRGRAVDPAAFAAWKAEKLRTTVLELFEFYFGSGYERHRALRNLADPDGWIRLEAAASFGRLQKLGLAERLDFVRACLAPGGSFELSRSGVLIRRRRRPPPQQQPPFGRPPP